MAWAQAPLPYLHDVKISHGASLLSLQGSLADGGIDWSLTTPALSDYLPLSGHARAQGKLKEADGGYAVTINTQAQELIVDKNVNDVLSDVAGAALQLQCRLQLDRVINRCGYSARMVQRPCRRRIGRQHPSGYYNRLQAIFCSYSKVNYRYHLSAFRNRQTLICSFVLLTHLFFQLTPTLSCALTWATYH